MSDQPSRRAAIAAAAALLFASTQSATVSAEEAKVRCEGVNACKGQSHCNTPQNACAGQNACKGKGFLLLTKKDCDAAQAKLQKPAT